MRSQYEQRVAACSIGAILASAAKRLKMSPSNIASRTGLSNKEVRQIMDGLPTTWQKIERLARATNVKREEWKELQFHLPSLSPNRERVRRNEFRRSHGRRRFMIAN